YEKARIENNFLTTAEQLEKQSQEYLKAIELAKFHEERGKIKCERYQCSESKRIQGEIKAQLFKDETNKKTIMIEGECSNCYEHKKVDTESGLCKRCCREQWG
ncbi:65_t:CDS:1, partial [Ambispora gerdemannii]